MPLVVDSFLKRAEIYPDSTGGSDQITFSYNRQSQVTVMVDQGGTTHAYDYDKLGRQTQDRVTALGTGVDGAVRRIASTYEVRGMRKTLTSYDNPTVGSGNIVNDNTFVYNVFSQLTIEYQSHSGAVNMSTTDKVQYTYASGSANTVRATGMVYPSGRVLTYAYGSTGSQSDRLSRVASYIDDDGTSHIVDYTYLGAASFVEGDRPQPQMKWTLVDLAGTNDPDTGDIYTGLDRFGRVKDNRWYGYGTSTDLDRIQYGYDRAGNRIWRRNTVAAALSKDFDEIYTYDAVHRLKDMARGLLNSSRTALTSKTFAQCWTLDSAGNWSGFREDDTGDGTWDLVQARSANDVNEITGITNSVGAAWVQPDYSPAGNMTTMPQPNDPTKGYTATYDAWNRLMKIVDTPTSNTVSEYTYDGAKRQIRQKNYDAGSLTETRHLYYTDPATWRCLEERLGTTPDTAPPDRQFVWGSRYIDDLILRDRDVTSSSSSSSAAIATDRIPPERRFMSSDGIWNVTASLSSTGAIVTRYYYSPFGNTAQATPDFSPRITLSDRDTYLFRTYRCDTPTGIQFSRNRALTPTTGSWLSRDSERYIDGYSLYLLYFVPNSVDPSGNALPLLPLIGGTYLIVLCTCYAKKRAWDKEFDVVDPTQEQSSCIKKAQLFMRPLSRCQNVPIGVGNNVPTPVTRCHAVCEAAGAAIPGSDAIYLGKPDVACDSCSGFLNLVMTLIHECVHTGQPCIARQNDNNAAEQHAYSVAIGRFKELKSKCLDLVNDGTCKSLGECAQAVDHIVETDQDFLDGLQGIE